MDRKTAEVLYLISEFSSENGQWFALCEYLEARGVTPQQIADAVNAAASAGGFAQQLSASDCQ